MECETIPLMNHYDTIVIGAGPAGLMAALSIPEEKKVLVLEKMPSPGRKLLVSGSGQCNITHIGTPEEFIPHYGKNGRFLKHALYEFPPKRLVSFFEERGVTFLIREDGKVFPESFKAKEILQVLLSELKKHNREIKCKSPVKAIYKTEDCFIIETDAEKYYTTSVVISTGGITWPQTGSTGDGQKYAETLGHTIISMKQALSGIHIKNFTLIKHAGVTIKNAIVSLLRNNKKVTHHAGDLLITHSGFSGPVILDNSRYWNKDNELSISFLPKDSDEVYDTLKNETVRNPKKQIKNIISSLELPLTLVETILSFENIDLSMKSNQIKDTQIRKLVEALQNYRVKIDEFDSIDKAMVTSGGVSLKEVHSKTMMSKVAPGLYFAGEVLDVDGDTGGYNLQAAFSTGYVAGKRVF